MSALPLKADIHQKKNPGIARGFVNQQAARLENGCRLFERSAVPPKIESQSANKQCHHFDRRHKTVPGENAPKHPTRNGDDERPTVLPDPVHHAFFPNPSYTGNQRAARFATNSLVGTSDSRTDFHLIWFGLPPHGRANARRRSGSYFPGDGMGPAQQFRTLPRSRKCRPWGYAAASRIYY